MWKIFDKLLLFFVRFFKGLQFAVLEYDSQLQRSSSTKQRVIFWMKVLIGLIIVFILVIVALRLIYSSFQNAIRF